MPTLRIVVADAETTPVPKRRVVVRPYGKTPVYTDGGNTLVEPASKWVDEAGEVLFDLPASADLLPTGTPYEVQLPGVRKPVLVEMPAGSGTVDIEDALVDPPGTVETAAVSAERAARIAADNAHRATLGDHEDVDLSGASTGNVLAKLGSGQWGPADVATDAEVDDKVAAEAAIRAAVDSAEAAARANADGTLQANIDSEAATRLAADQAEALARAEADTLEAATREDADSALTTSIATKADQTALDAEEDARIAADAAETASRIAGDALKAPRAIEVDPALASAIEADLRPSAHQIVDAPAQDIHGLVRVGDYLYGSHRTIPGRITRFHVDDLSDQETMVFPADNRHNGGDALVYVAEKNRLYVLHGGSTAGGMRVLISEVHPETLVATDFVNDTTRWGTRTPSGPAMTSDGEYLYVITAPSLISDDRPSEIVKYSLEDGSVVDALTLTDSYNGHSITHNGTHVFASGTNVEHDVAAAAWVVKADMATLTLANREVLTDTTYDNPTDDMCAVGDYLYMGLETSPGSSDGVIQRRRVSDLTLDQNIVVTGVGDALSYGTFWDGRYVWSLWSTSPGLAVLIDPQTLEQRRFTFPTGENSPNEFATDGRRVFFTHWGSPARVSRYTLPTLTEQAGTATASDVTFTPTGNIAATNVQNALAELDTEKVATTDLRLPTTRIRTTDSAPITSSTALVSDDTLRFPVVPGVYFVEAYLLMSTANATMDAKFGWSGPAGTLAWWGPNGRPATDFATWGAQAVAGSANGPISITGTYSHGTNTSTSAVALFATIETVANGDVILQYAQNTSDAGAFKLLKNSLLRVQRLT